jgi:hypothetical protein
LNLIDNGIDLTGFCDAAWQARLALVETEKHTVQQTMEHELSQTEAAQLQLRDELMQLQHDIEVPPTSHPAPPQPYIMPSFETCSELPTPPRPCAHRAEARPEH